MLTNHPVRKLGRQPFRKIPFAHLTDVQRACKLDTERDLRSAPIPISGGMRKALAKETAHQNSLRFKVHRRYREPDLKRAYGLLQAVCKHCRHVMYFDDVGDDFRFRCDRCKRVT